MVHLRKLLAAQVCEASGSWSCPPCWYCGILGLGSVLLYSAALLPGSPWDVGPTKGRAARLCWVLLVGAPLTVGVAGGIPVLSSPTEWQADVVATILPCECSLARPRLGYPATRGLGAVGEPSFVPRGWAPLFSKLPRRVGRVCGRMLLVEPQKGALSRSCSF